jgi:hypothetical protein
VDAQGVLLIVRIVTLFLFGGLAFFAYLGWRAIKSAEDLPFFRLRRRRVARGWRLVLLGLLLGAIAVILLVVGPNAAEGLLPGTSTALVDDATPRSSTATLTATIKLSPEETATASITPSPTERGTPMLPEGISVLFRESVTPDTRAVFGPIHVTTEVLYPAYPDDEVFETAEGMLYGLFSYDFLESGVRWTAAWLWENDVVCVDTKPWDGESGGWGYTECELDQWPAGEYFIHIFLGEEWWISTQFMVLNAAQTPTPEDTTTPVPSP